MCKIFFIKNLISYQHFDNELLSFKEQNFLKINLKNKRGFYLRFICTINKLEMYENSYETHNIQKLLAQVHEYLFL